MTPSERLDQACELEAGYATAATLRDVEELERYARELGAELRSRSPHAAYLGSSAGRALCVAYALYDRLGACDPETARLAAARLRALLARGLLRRRQR